MEPMSLKFYIVSRGLW